MAPDLSEKLLGIDIDDTEGRNRRDDTSDDDTQEELAQFVFFGLGDQRFAVPVDAVRTLADVPDEMTRVPRSPPAIEGMVDLRGEITAVVDPHIHFPGIESVDETGNERLLVVDRPSDQQSAAIRVDDVDGVETVPESDVVDERTLEDRPFDGDALDHPLVVALIEQKHEPERSVGDTLASRSDGNPADETGDGDAGALSSQGPLGGPGDAVGTTFDLEGDESDESEAADDASTREVIIEVTPLLDVDKLLLASGHADG